MARVMTEDLPQEEASILFDDLKRLSVGELRRRCHDFSIDTSTFLEKTELVAALARGLGVAARVSSFAFEANLKELTSSSGLKTLIFLDVDGVLNASNTFPAVRLDPECCARLVRLAKLTEAGIVLSTTWRHDDGLKMELLDALEKAGASPCSIIVGQTPNIATDKRAGEIQSWLDEHPINIPFVILDDLPLSGELSDHGVWVDPEVGLQDADVERVLECLARQT